MKLYNGIGAVETGTPPDFTGTGQGTVIKPSFFDKVKDSQTAQTASTFLQQLAQNAAQVKPIIDGGLVVQANPNLEPEKNWFMKDDLINGIQNWIVTAAGSAIVIGGIFILTDEQPKSKKKR